MTERAESVRVAYPLFQAEGGGSSPTSALDLFFAPADLDRAIELNRLWHSRLPVVVRSNITRNSNRVCYTAECGNLHYAVAIWTNPVARLLPQQTALELRRLAVSPDAPKNTASRMLGWMVRDIRRRFPAVNRLVSYQDTEIHAGTIYRAAGWIPVATAEASHGNHHQWSNKSRVRNKAQSNAPKVRWEKHLLAECREAERRLRTLCEGVLRTEQPGLFDGEGEPAG